MTIRAIADQLGVTPVTIYRRLKQRGIDVATLRDADGNVTTEGAGVIASLFDATPDEKAIQGIIGAVNHDIPNDTKQDATALQTECAVLRVRLEAAERDVERLEAEAERLRAERDRLLSMLEQEQQQRVRLLEGGKRRGFWAWIRGRGGDSSGE